MTSFTDTSSRYFTTAAAILFVCVGLLFTSVSHADTPTFTYVELEYIASGDIKVADDNLSVSVDADGFALNLSAEFGIFLLQASRTELESDVILDSNLEDSISTIALGLTLGFPRTAIYGLVRARRDELALTGGGFDENEDGGSVGVEAGVRVNLTDHLEINANVGSPSIGDGSSFGVGAQFYITDRIGITLDHNSVEVEESDITADIDTTSIGVRFNF